MNPTATQMKEIDYASKAEDAHEDLEMAVRTALDYANTGMRWMVSVSPDLVRVAIADPQNEGEPMFGQWIDIMLNDRHGEQKEGSLELNFPSFGYIDPLGNDPDAARLRAIASVSQRDRAENILYAFRRYRRLVRKCRQNQEQNTQA